MRFGLGVSQSQPPSSVGTTQPQRASSGGKMEGWLWRCPAPAAGLFWGPRGGRTLLPCQQHLQNAAWMGSLQRRHSPAPGEGFPPPLSHQSPLRGGGSPQSVLVWAGIPNWSSSGDVVIPGEGGNPWWLLQGPQMSAGQAGIWGCWGWVWKVQEPGSRICTTPPQCRGRNGGTLQPWGCKMPPHPLIEPPLISEPPSPHKGLIWLQD